MASSDLVNMGISVVSYTLKDIHDDQVPPGGGHRRCRGHVRPRGLLRWAAGTGDTGWGRRRGRSERHWGDMVGKGMSEQSVALGTWGPGEVGTVTRG